MPKKKSSKKVVRDFMAEVKAVEDFLSPGNLSGFSDDYVPWAYDYAVIRLFQSFESMIFHCLIAAVNNDTGQLARTKGSYFPKHVPVDACRYTIVGDGNFAFRSWSDLIGQLSSHLSRDHYLVEIIKRSEYVTPLEQLSALRDFAASASEPSKKRALATVGRKKMSSAGMWLKTGDRFENLAEWLKRLADEIHWRAPY